MPKYHAPEGAHVVSIGDRTFEVDEDGQIDVVDQPSDIVQALVTLGGCRPVRDDHPPVPVPPQPPAATEPDAETETSTAEADPSAGETESSTDGAAEDDGTAAGAPADSAKLRLNKGGGIKPPRKKAE